MLVRTYGSALHGVDAITITVEVNWMRTGYGYQLVGLPDNAVKESLSRVESALKSMDISLPRTRCVINLAPADLRKYGTAFDLAIAIGFLGASGHIEEIELLADYLIMGELGLNGDLRPIRGALSIASQAAKEGFKGVILPQANAKEAGMVQDLNVFGLEHLSEVLQFFTHEREFKPVRIDPADLFPPEPLEKELDFADVKGQENIKRALEIAAAGGHNAIMIGPPGAGKTMLARRLPTILPPLTLDEALESTRLHSVAGKLGEFPTIVSRRPFRSPHHSISDAGLIGGGSHPQPGEISLAHNGVLFLDELPEFKRAVLEVMRQPMEERKVTIARAKIALEFPASFMLIASMNPCPCGFYNHPDKSCTCPHGAVQKYIARISGPLMDRIDLHVEVTPVHFSQLSMQQNAESSSVIRERVMMAREIQKKRFAGFASVHSNSQMGTKMLREFCVLNTASQQLLRSAMEKLNLSARAYDRILKVSRTIADLGGSVAVQAEHLAEAINYRTLDRESWTTGTPF